jgi:16S rRNA (uracil1498-N3)-methyltransferase
MRVLLPPGAAVEGGRCRLSEEEGHHLRVRRAADGETVEIRDGAGLTGTGRLLKSPNGFEVEVVKARRDPRGSPLTLVVGAGDKERFAWLVEKAAELGVTRLVPLETERTAGVATRLRAGQLDKLRRLALETTKQCGAAWAPEVAAPASIDELVEAPPDGIRWLAEAGGAPAPAGLDSAPVTVVIGPEGGLTPTESDRLRAAGYHPVTLGPFTLRFETAAIAAAAVVAAARQRGNHG